MRTCGVMRKHAGVIAEVGEEGGAAAGVMASTRLRVLDVNEHAPSFHSQPYVVQLAENTPPDSYVVQRKSALVM